MRGQVCLTPVSFILPPSSFSLRRGVGSKVGALAAGHFAAEITAQLHSVHWGEYCGLSLLSDPRFGRVTSLEPGAEAPATSLTVLSLKSGES